jgi:glycosyltransferase involved in cell wall biosynthesis
MFLSYNKNLYVTAISTSKIEVPPEYKIKQVSNKVKVQVGKRMPTELLNPEDYTKKDIKDLRVAMIANWGDQCGIATYTAYLCSAMKPMVKELKIFSEVNESVPIEEGVEQCWKRGECLLGLVKKIKEFGADYVILQHEYGLFFSANFFSQFLQHLEDIPYLVQTHSVYSSHLDKFCYTQCIKNICVHTEEQKNVYKKLGSSARIFTVPHGCIEYEDTSELYNINHNPYTVVQAGFPNKYKGLNRALEAISILKKNDTKFKNIFFSYLMSETGRSPIADQNYYDELMELAEKLDVVENFAIIRKYQSEASLCLFFRLNKLAIFPYINDKEGAVRSASGAVRIAMANHIPVIASESFLFDDVRNVVPCPDSAEKLAAEIDKIFSNSIYRNELVNKASKYVEDNSWEKSALGYLNIYNQLAQP